MKLFIDTANLEEIREAASWGLIEGVTTNPSLLAKELGKAGAPVRFEEVIHEICRLIDGPVSAEVTSEQAPAMVEEARRLAAIHEHVVVKIPMTLEGLKAVGRLSAEGIRTNVTLVFSPTQALLAAKAGASYVSPFVGRIDDRSGDGMELVAQILQIFDNYGFPTEVIVASVRHPRHVLEAALLGAEIATVPYAVLRALFAHPLTDLGLEGFRADWERANRPG
ncbi:MAG: fructose-6-phosphate aldolase [Candidatus Acetothermia bacterium]|jgi:transaldolase|nr:fructose-6-phosphate aldolase [Candidatus Acetothermia bacterium]MDH7505229.1 fructose-6-phosphate aldolase [Candidatus Acetothermia bacterium]